MSEEGEKRHPGGRPTLYRPEYCDELVEFARKGFSLGAFAGQIGVSHQTVKDWKERHPEFLAACERASPARQLHWEEKAIRVGERGGGPGTAQIIQFALNNIGGLDKGEWRNKQELEHTGPNGGPMQVQRIERVVVDPSNSDS